MNIVILTRADWSGSGHDATQAINTIGRVNCRHICLHKHLYDYPTDILLPVCFNKRLKIKSCEQYDEAMEVLEAADSIHLWNEEIPELSAVIPFDAAKVRSHTFTGSMYRKGHSAIHKRLGGKIKLVIQNPSYIYGEKDVEFIPHAVNTGFLVPLKPHERNRFDFGVYSPVHGSTTAKKDLGTLGSILNQAQGPWRIELAKGLWLDRLEKIKHCHFFFEYLDENMAYIGRSALEACAFGIPTFSYYSRLAIRFARGRIGDMDGITFVNRGNVVEIVGKAVRFMDCMKKLRKQEAAYKRMGEASRAWIEKYYSYPVVGEYYTRFFEKL